MRKGNRAPLNWGETFTIDNWGNLTNKAQYPGKTMYELLNAAPAAVSNQLNGYCHDSAGNLVLNGACPQGSFSPTYTYDGENRLTNTVGWTYIYDGDGKRAIKCSGSPCSSGTLYWTGTGSDPLGESSWSGSMAEEYTFFDSKRVARRDVSGNAVHYYFSDYLSSTSVITSSTGSIQKEADYYPYGGEIVITGSDINNYKFTGKERDAETGLDYFGARYYGSTMGRFTSVDPILSTLRPENPQTLNRYTYTLNNPLRYTDPTGKYEQDVHQDLTTVLAMAAGFDADTAAAIGEADNRIDAGGTQRKWSEYHFTTSERRDELWNQFDKSGSTSDLGAFLHAEQDSYSHAGLSPTTHALKLTAPDKTYNDPGKADNMAKDTYQRLSAAAGRLGIDPKNQVAWSKIDKLVGEFDKAKTKEDKNKILGQIRDVIAKAQQEQQKQKTPKKKEEAQ